MMINQYVLSDSCTNPTSLNQCPNLTSPVHVSNPSTLHNCAHLPFIHFLYTRADVPPIRTKYTPSHARARQSRARCPRTRRFSACARRCRFRNRRQCDRGSRKKCAHRIHKPMELGRCCKHIHEHWPRRRSCIHLIHASNPQLWALSVEERFDQFDPSVPHWLATKWVVKKLPRRGQRSIAHRSCRLQWQHDNTTVLWYFKHTCKANCCPLLSSLARRVTEACMYMYMAYGNGIWHERWKRVSCTCIHMHPNVQCGACMWNVYTSL